MSPRGRSFAAVSPAALSSAASQMSGARPFSPSAASTSSSSTMSTLPPYAGGSPPPAYPSSTTGSTKGKHISSAVAMQCPSAPMLQLIDLPEVKNAEAITTQQSRQYMSRILLQADRSLDFSRPLPDLSHLGDATSPAVYTLPITLPFSTTIYYVSSPIPGRAVSIHDVAHYVSSILNKPITEKDALRCSLAAQWIGKRLIDRLIHIGKTRFGGLQLTSLGGKDCVWMVNFIS